jgi:hypothetical protein
MTFVTADLVQETTTTTGTGAITLAGATTGKITFGSKMANGDTCFAVIDDGAGLYEGGLVTWNTGGTLTRSAGNVVFGSSGAGVLVTFGAGTKTVTLAPISSKILQLNDTLACLFPAIAAEPVTPAAGFGYLYGKELAGGRFLPKVKGQYGNDAWMQPAIFNNKVGIWQPQGNSTTLPGVFGQSAPTAVGTVTARNVATTNLFTRLRRLGYIGSSLAGSLAGHYDTTAQHTLGVPGTPNIGGFFLCVRFGCSDAATVSGARQFVGMTSAINAPSNAEPSGLTNCIGVGHGAADTNLKIYYGGSSAQAAIDLGANFPANTLSVDPYELYLYAPPSQNAKVHYRIVNLRTDNSANGTLTAATPGTQLPLNTTFLAFRAWRSNNATSLAVGLDIVSRYLETDY